MIHRIKMSNFGPIASLEADGLKNLNLIIGRNGNGKTFLLKALYAATKVTEQYKRGKEQRTFAELLQDKLYWTFQPEKIGDLVRRGENRLEMDMDMMVGKRLGKVSFGFGPSTSKTILAPVNTVETTDVNSIFLPAKEIVSLQEIIKESRSEKYNAFGFDDTYYDLAMALTPTTKGKNYKAFASAREELNKTIRGRIEYDKDKKEWIFKDNANRTYAIGMTAEGVKKVAVLDALLGNHYLSRDSVVFIDEPEANLHPELISKFMDIIYTLSEIGIQFFIATHSYFVIKKMYLLAHQHGISVPILSMEEENGWNQYDLKEEMPDNPIIAESVRLYQEEVML